MPLVRMTRSVGCEDLPSRRGAEVQLTAERAQQVVAAGWGVIVRSRAPETPEGRRVEGLETADRSAPRRKVQRKTTPAE